VDLPVSAAGRNSFDGRRLGRRVHIPPSLLGCWQRGCRRLVEGRKRRVQAGIPSGNWLGSYRERRGGCLEQGHTVRCPALHCRGRRRTILACRGQPLQAWTRRQAGPAPLVHRIIDPDAPRAASLPFCRGGRGAHAARGSGSLGCRPKGCGCQSPACAGTLATSTALGYPAGGHRWGQLAG